MTQKLLTRRNVLLAGAGALGMALYYKLSTATPFQTPWPRPNQFSSRDVTFRNGTIALQGTLYMPDGAAQVPGIVLAHGSGDVDRSNRRLRFEAEGLASRGFACLVYDKRGCGSSGGNWRESDFHELAGDLSKALEFLRQQERIDPKRTGLRGASQAGYVMPIAAAMAPLPAFMVMIAGPMVTIADQILYEASVSIEEAGLTPQERDQAMALARQALEFARTGIGGDAYFSRVREVSDTAWFKASPTPDESEMWFFHWLRPIIDFDPAPYFKTMATPVRAYFGEKDTLVPTQVARQRLEALYQGIRTSLLTIVEYKNAGHDLRYPDADGEKIFAPDYLNGMAEWMHGLPTS